MADVNFTPTFHHADWLDRVDRVEAGGPNGFNTRFRAVEHDLRKLSTVVTDISTRIARIHTAPAPDPGQQQRFSFTPRFHLLDDGNDPTEWFISELGTAEAVAGRAHGIMNLTLPDQVRLTSMRIRGNVRGSTGVPPRLIVTLARTPIRLTSAPATVEPVLGLAVVGLGDFNLARNITGDAAMIDHRAFRYVVDALFTSDAPDGNTVDLVGVEFTFQPR
jgi:hypothetical protein